MISTEILKSFCGDKVFNGRESLRKPFNQGEFTYAADGVLCIRVPLIKRYNGNIGPDVSKLWKQYSNDLKFTPLPTIDKCVLAYHFTVGVIVEIDGMLFCHQVIKRLSVFDSVEVAVVYSKMETKLPVKASFFRFDGGEGLFMPVRV